MHFAAVRSAGVGTNFMEGQMDAVCSRLSFFLLHFSPSPFLSVDHLDHSGISLLDIHRRPGGRWMSEVAVGSVGSASPTLLQTPPFGHTSLANLDCCEGQGSVFWKIPSQTRVVIKLLKITWTHTVFLQIGNFSSLWSLLLSIHLFSSTPFILVDPLILVDLRILIESLILIDDLILLDLRILVDPLIFVDPRIFV